MPFIHVKTNVPVSSEKEQALKAALGQAIAIIPGKSERWLMVEIDPERRLWFQGENTPAAMVEVSAYGSAQPKVYEELTREICTVLHDTLSLDPARTYVKYEETPHWGWNGGNF